MTGEWRWLVNLLVALVFLACAIYLFAQGSWYMAGKRDPSVGRYFSGESLRWLILALLLMAAHAAYWAWRVSRPAQESISSSYFWLIGPIVLLAAAVLSGVIAYQKAEPGRPPPVQSPRTGEP
jgi:cytochrome bd-type quinol oxidase subunit 2